MTHTVYSEEFTTATGFRKAYKEAREKALELLPMIDGKTPRARFKPNCYLLQTKFGQGGWVNHVTGLTRSELKVKDYEGAAVTHRLVIRFDK